MIIYATFWQKCDFGKVCIKKHYLNRRYLFSCQLIRSSCSKQTAAVFLQTFDNIVKGHVGSNIDDINEACVRMFNKEAIVGPGETVAFKGSNPSQRRSQPNYYRSRSLAEFTEASTNGVWQNDRPVAGSRGFYWSTATSPPVSRKNRTSPALSLLSVKSSPADRSLPCQSESQPVTTVWSIL